MKKTLNSIVVVPKSRSGGVKSLYFICDVLKLFGKSSIVSIDQPPKLAGWFKHKAKLYDGSYTPDLVIYPEVFQAPFTNVPNKICFALGQHAPIKPHADLVICKSPQVQKWVQASVPHIPTRILQPSIDLDLFTYDGRPKKKQVAYMTRANKHPEMAKLLKERFGHQFLEIKNASEQEVATALKESHIFVWRGHDFEGSPRPPKEALAAGCHVIGLSKDLNADLFTDFGVQCSSVQEILDQTEKYLNIPIPDSNEVLELRDTTAERNDFISLINEFISQNVDSELSL